jgi:CDP-diacylglycerol---serine O-phosphatidyltransferase
MFLGLILVYREKILYYVLPAVFTAYLLYGFIRPRISRRVRHEIEEEDDDEEEGASAPR